jgi:hypothetical protein
LFFHSSEADFLARLLDSGENVGGLSRAGNLEKKFTSIRSELTYNPTEEKVE